MINREIPLPSAELLFMGETHDNFLEKSIAVLELVWEDISSVSSIIDIGCGYGRLAYALRHRGYKGTYLGVDILNKQIFWLQNNFTARDSAFEFRHIDVKNDRYNPDGAAQPENVDLSAFGCAFEAVILLSVFTHMYPNEIECYLRAIRKICTKRTKVLATFFCVESAAARPYTFDHQITEFCFTWKLEDPLYAIGYKKTWIEDVGLRSGFTMDIREGFQDIVLFSAM